jgi:hypothetical protein
VSDNVIQTSFSAGELSPSLFARVDFAKYRSGAATMRNFFVDYRSGASTRPGTEFIRPGALGSSKIRLVRFQQSVDVTYVLEFGQTYLRFISEGSSIVKPAIGINNISNAALGLVSADTSTLSAGVPTVFISGVLGMPEINNRYYAVINKTPTSFNLVDALTNIPVDTTNFGAYGGGGTIQELFTITTPYTADELALLKFSQNAAVMNITHPNHPPYVLTLITATNWTLVPAVFGATVGSPTVTAVTSSGSGLVQYKYTVTAVDSNNQEGVNGNVNVLIGGQDLRVTAGTNLIQWGPVANAVSYNIYGSPASYVSLAPDTGGVGFIGSVSANINSFADSNISADFQQTPPIHENPFASVNPAVSSYFQQRLVYANGGGQLVATFWASKTGAPYNFDVSNPTQANDSISGALVSLEVNEIKSLVPMPTGLVALTTKGAWQINGGAGGVATQGGPITPATATATPQAYIGANDVPPIVVNYDIIFVQQKGSIVRDMTFNIYANIYTGNDISIMSNHLFYDHQILEWAYAEEPFKIIWCVREDGILLSLTLVKEQDMYGWARHDTLGNFKSVCTVTEGTVDATYFVVERPDPVSPGKTRLSIERLADRTFPFGAEDAWCVDSGVASISNFPNASLAVSATTGANVSLTANPGVFTSGMVDWVIRSGGGIIKVTSVTSGQVAHGNVLQKITDVLPNDALQRPDVALPGTWTLDKPFTKIFGLDHLEGRTVSVLADGGVVNGLVVHNGSVTLPSAATKAVVGYGFQAQLQTMYLDLGNEVNTVQGKRKKVGALTVRVKDSRGLKAGRIFDTVTPIKELNRTTVMGLPTKLITADERIVMDPLWDVPGQICLQVDDPLPSTVLGVVPEIVIGDSQK